MARNRRPVRALCLFSGGLDSVLAARLISGLGIEVLGLCFVSAFFNDEKAVPAADAIGLALESVDFTVEHLDLVRNPPHGYGKNMNPCIDCHALMLRRAGLILDERGYDFIFTGEVLGERPMSQNRNALRQVARLSGYRDRILRPLSALCMDETPVESRGLVDRSKLCEISGRSRKPQMALAARLGITGYETPAGGCKLTEPGYSRRLKSLFERFPDAGPRECRLISMGRMFWVGPRAMATVGRRHGENLRIAEMAGPGDLLIEATPPIPGPTVLLSGLFGPEEIRFAAGIAVRYGDGRRKGRVRVRLTAADGKADYIEVSAAADDEIDLVRVS